MLTKNNWKKPIRIGRQVIAKGAVEEIPDHLLLQPRVQKLREAKKLIFPYHAAKLETPPSPAVFDTAAASDEPYKAVEIVEDIQAGEE